MLSVGALIWISVRPLLRLVICVGCGFAVTKADIFPPVAARGAAQIMLNIALPALMFSTIVPTFTAANIGAVGPLVLVAFLYEGIGIVLAWIIKQFFWVPHRFRYGILVAGGWGNYGDIPTSVVMALTAASPFNVPRDQVVSVAYVSAFILVFIVTLFPLGGHRWIAMDFDGPDVEDEDVKEAIRVKRKQLASPSKWIPMLRRRRSVTTPTSLQTPQPQTPIDLEKQLEKLDASSSPDRPPPAQPSSNPRDRVVKQVSLDSDATSTIVQTEPISILTTSPPGCSPNQSDIGTSRVTSPIAVGGAGLPPISETTSVDTQPRRHTRIIRRIIEIIRSLLTPATIAILISFPIALIPPLKALFIAPTKNEATKFHIPAAPDGHPPLFFLIDTASFMGSACVPLGLICLGAALARLKLPTSSAGRWGSLPIGAISCLTVGKMLIMPVIGVVICEGLVKVGLINSEDKVLRFVCIFFSCLPTATSQVLLTQVYSGTGTAEHLSAFIIPQYILMFPAMTALTAYSLNLLF